MGPPELSVLFLKFPDIIFFSPPHCRRGCVADKDVQCRDASHDVVGSDHLPQGQEKQFSLHYSALFKARTEQRMDNRCLYVWVCVC